MKFWYSIYFSLPALARYGMGGKVIDKLLEKLLKFIFDRTVPKYLKISSKDQANGLTEEKRKETYIVSLTSFPARIDEIWITIETILRQSFKPDKIILWLGEKQFKNRKLPDSLVKLCDRGLLIKFVEDVRSHTKYYYAIQQFPYANIITLDDDEYYPEDVLENLLALHSKFPFAICANRAHRITFNSQGAIMPYRKWKHNFKDIRIPSHQLLLTGVGGVLYPPNSLHIDVFKKEVFKEICFMADDVWLTVMSYRKGTKIVTNNKYNKDFITVSKTQKENLVNINVFDGGNDIQFNHVCDYYSVNFNNHIDE